MKTVTDYLQDLIRIPSASSLSNRGVIEYARLILRDAGWHIALTEYVDSCGVEKMNLIAAPQGQSPEQPVVDLAILCHTDTIPPARGWSKALEPLINNGVLYGCGACDVKGFLACLLVAAHQAPTGHSAPVCGWSSPPMKRSGASVRIIC